MADAFRQIGDTDISIVNAGAVRNNLPAGEITFNTIMDVLPYSTNVVIGELKGQTILDALEYGCKDMPVKSGAFPQVSGLEFTVDPNIKSSVETNEVGDFVKVASDRRVSNVLVDGKPLDPEADYTITAAEFLLTGGDHYTMFKNDARITGTTNMTDNTLLAEYIEKNLNGVIPENYRQAEGRIHVIEEETEAQQAARADAEAILEAVMAESMIAEADMDAIARTVDDTYYAATGQFTTNDPADADVDSSVAEAAAGLEDGELVDHVVKSADGTRYYVVRVDHVFDEEATAEKKKCRVCSFRTGNS